MRSLRFAFFAALFAFAPFAHAQIIPSFGVAGGLNFSSLSDVTDVELGSSTGYHIGIFGDVGIGPLAFRASVLYVSFGELEGDATTDGDNEVGIAFVAIPIDFKFQFPTPVVKPYALLGPEFRFPAADLADFEGNRSVNVALNAGVGVGLNAIVGPKAFAELRYGFDVTGFADGADVPFLGVADDDTFKLNAFYLRIGVSF